LGRSARQIVGRPTTRPEDRKPLLSAPAARATPGPVDVFQIRQPAAEVHGTFPWSGSRTQSDPSAAFDANRIGPVGPPQRGQTGCGGTGCQPGPGGPLVSSS